MRRGRRQLQSEEAIKIDPLVDVIGIEHAPTAYCILSIAFGQITFVHVALFFPFSFRVISNMSIFCPQRVILAAVAIETSQKYFV